MTAGRSGWLSNSGTAAGKGATVQQFYMKVGKDRFEMDVSPWGEGDLRKNGTSIAHVTGRKNRREVFMALKKIADDVLKSGDLKP